ncbi:phage/plasmid-related protein TIGR03299 [[Clostridium] cf. saccharolyticum K10]|nr:phage/plasmid-related protein TIGR03299 [[Clostridium] cf. saccharolyticum K10]
MSANVESMFYTRVTPWHGLGTRVEEAPDSKEALKLAGLDWRVIQKPIQTEDGQPVSGFKANIRDQDSQILGVVTDRYQVVQNEDAFAFTDELLGEGVVYETAGSLQKGRRTWILAKLPQRYIISGDEITPYLVFMNSHDGTGAIKAAMTPVRVVCQNTLNLALSTAKRSWSTVHTGNIQGKLEDARNTLLYADRYMAELGKAVDELQQIRLSDKKVYEYINALFPLVDGATEQQKKNLLKLKEDVKLRYFEAPDLKQVGKNGYRFINAVSDFATHAKPLRARNNYRESLFARTVDGNALIDRAYQMLRAA